MIERLLAEMAVLDPCAAVVEGGEQDVGTLTDYSPEGHQARADLAARWLREIDDPHVVERLRTRLAWHDSGEDLRELHVAATGPLQMIRQAIEAAVPGPDADVEQGWEWVAARLDAVPAALDGYARSLKAAARPSRRQVELAAGRCRNWIADDTALVDRYGDGRQRAALRAAAGRSRQAYIRLAETLTTDLTPQDEEAFGEERYALWVRSFLASQPDLRELYAWGWDEFRTIEAQLGANVPETVARLDGAALQSRDAFAGWLQELLDTTTERLDGTHFDIPAPLRRLESRVVTSGGTAYTGPSRDLTRPGRVWWFLPEGQTRFPTWYAYSVAYHEGVPGHHLHLGSQACRGGLRLDLLGGLSGCQEGWALYAERFMDELGLYEQPGARLGYLLSQLLRAARVVLDIGLHLRLPKPFGDRAVWTPDAALAFLRDRCHQGPYAAGEIARYLGRPGQALAYKAGERVWLAGRAASGGDVRAFHRRALELGSLGLDQLAVALRAPDEGVGDHPRM